MGSNSPPDAWIVESGVWGTDIDREETTLISGVAGLVFNNTTPADDPSMITRPEVIRQNTFYMCSVTYQADRSDPGDDITIDIVFYNAAGGVAGTRNIKSSTATATGVFETVGQGLSTTIPAGSAAIAVRVKKANTDFQLIVDRVILERVNPVASLYQAQGAVTIGATTVVDFYASFQTDATGVVLTPDATNDIINIYEPGLYLVSYRIAMQGFSSGDYLDASLVLVGQDYAATPRGHEVSADIYGANDTIMCAATLPLYFTGPNMSVQLQYYVSTVGAPIWSTEGAIYERNYLHATRMTPP